MAKLLNGQKTKHKAKDNIIVYQKSKTLANKNLDEDSKDNADQSSKDWMKMRKKKRMIMRRKNPMICQGRIR